MSLETIRSALVGAIEAAKAGAPVSPLIIEYDNRLIVDSQTQSLPFLSISIKLQGGVQADISSAPIQRIFGQLHMAAVVKEGSGSAKALTLLDYIYPKLQLKQFGGVRTRIATFTRQSTELGLAYYPVLIPFWYDKIVTV